MVRVGGMGYTINVDARHGQPHRATCTSWAPARRSRPSKDYVVAGWGSVNEGTEGPPIWDVVAAHLKGRQHALAAAAQIGQGRARRRLTRRAACGRLASCITDLRQRRMLTQVYIHLGVALAGLVSFLSPCVLPLVPPYLGYLSGTTIEQMTARRRLDDQRLAARRAGLACCSCWASPRCSWRSGAGASVLGQWVQDHKAQLSVVAGLVIIGFGLHFLGLLRVPLLYRQARFRTQVEGASLAGAYVMGLAFAFGWTPCIGPVLATVLTLAASEASLGAGVRLLFVYSLGLGIPFVLAAMAIGPFFAFLQRFRQHLGRVEMVMGAAAGRHGRADADGLAQLVRAVADRERADAGAHRGDVHAGAAADRDPERGGADDGRPAPRSRSPSPAPTARAAPASRRTSRRSRRSASTAPR